MKKNAKTAKNVTIHLRNSVVRRFILVLNLGGLGDRAEFCDEIESSGDVKGFVKAKMFDARIDGNPKPSMKHE